MNLTEKNHIAVINSYSKQHWQPLLDLIPEIENTTVFEEVHFKHNAEEDIIELISVTRAGIVDHFHKLVYEIPIIIEFSWSSWTEGRNILANENFDFDTIDIPVKCKLITAIVRNNRFCDGALASAFESGKILKILKSIRNQISKS